VFFFFPDQSMLNRALPRILAVNAKSIFHIQAHLFEAPIISNTYTRRQMSKSTETMAGSDFDEAIDSMEHLGMEDRGSKGGRGGRGKGKGRGGRERGGGRPQNRETQVSKALSQLLRHKAEESGVALDREGFARVDQVVHWHLFLTMCFYFFGCILITWIYRCDGCFGCYGNET